jgi:hypothetical protein
MIYKDKWTIKNKESLDELGNDIKYDNLQPGNDRENVLTISKRVISNYKLNAFRVHFPIKWYAVLRNFKRHADAYNI